MVKRVLESLLFSAFFTFSIDEHRVPQPLPLKHTTMNRAVIRR